MYIFDESAYPVVRLTSKGQATLADAEYYVRTMDDLLARQERFAVLMFDDNENDNNRDNQVSNYTVKWLKGARPQIGLWCAGIAALSNNQEWREKYGPMMEERGVQIYGCPVHVAATEADALDWLAERLQQSSLT